MSLYGVPACLMCLLQRRHVTTNRASPAHMIRGYRSLDNWSLRVTVNL